MPLDRDDVCQTCGAPASGSYCSRCGQRLTTDRFTLPGIVSSAVADFLDLERGGLRTLSALSAHPGRVIRDYWDRRTRRYVSPARYFLVAIAFFQIVLWQTGGAGAMVRGFLDASEEGERNLGDVASQAEALQAFGDYFVVFFAVGVLLLAGISRLGSPRNLAEELILHLYAWGHLAIVWGLAALLGHAVTVSKPLQLAYGFGVLALTVGYYVWTHIAAHRPDTGRSRWREGLEAVALLVLFMVMYTALAGFVAGLLISILEDA